MDKNERVAAIDAAEKEVGSTLPPKLRQILHNEGEVWFKPPEGVGADPVFKISATAKGAALFADQQGKEIAELGGWDSHAEGWGLTERAFLALDNQCGDTVLLAPDDMGVARKLVFCNHETGELELWAEDIEHLLVSGSKSD